ncbi:MAG: hypothetical protein JNL75_09155 [Chitinophagales bacterium]|nr:hypothetical protein [Chitinophagales bacterium]
MNYKRIIGYEKLDNMITGFILGCLAIGLAYNLQIAYYNIEALGNYGEGIKDDILKLSLLGGLFTFLVLNYFDKVYAMKGVLLSVILVGIYFVYRYFSN